MTLNLLLRKGNNNIDSLRLIAALAVIYGHAYAITPQPPYVDFLGAHIAGEYSGSIAVKFFFFLSGLLVTNSLVREVRTINFAVTRTVRLLPGLIVCLIVTTYVVAPLFSTQSAQSYFASPVPHAYAWLGVTFRPEWALPGVFATNPMTAVNGSLWTLPHELRCYVMLAAMAATYALWIKRSALSAAIAVVAVLVAFKLGAFSPPRADAMPLMICFFSGVLICLFGREISFSKWLACGLIFLLWLSSASAAFASIAVIAILVSGLYVSTLPAVKWIRLPGDYSYGVYLYGFFVQQCLKAACPALDLPTHQLLSMLIAVICGALSWHLVERPAMLFWKRLAANRAAR